MFDCAEVQQDRADKAGRSTSPRSERSEASNRGLTLPKPSKSKTPPKERVQKGGPTDPPAKEFLGGAPSATAATEVQAASASAAAVSTPPSPRSEKQDFLEFTGPGASEAGMAAGVAEGSGLKLPKPSKSKTPPKERVQHGHPSDPPAKEFFGGAPSAAATQVQAASAAEAGMAAGVAGAGGLKLPKPSRSKTPPKKQVHHGHPGDPLTKEFFGGAPSTADATEVQAASASAAAVSTPPSPRSEQQDFLDFSARGSGLKLPKPSKSQTPPKERVHHEHPNSPPATEFFGGAPSTAEAAEVQAASASAAAVSTPPSPRSEKQDFLEFTGPGASEVGMAAGVAGGSGLKLPKPSKSQTPPKERAHHEHSSDPPAKEFFGGAPSAAATQVQAASAEAGMAAGLAGAGGLKLPKPSRSKTPPKKQVHHGHLGDRPTKEFFGGAPSTADATEVQAASASAAAVSTPPSPRSEQQDFLDFSAGGSGLKLPKPSKSQTPPKERVHHEHPNSPPATEFFGGAPSTASATEVQAASASAAAVSTPPSPRSEKQDFLEFTGPGTSEAGMAAGVAGGGGLKLPKPSRSKTPPKKQVHHGHPGDPPTKEFFGGAPSTADATEVQAASASAAAVSTPPSPRSEQQDFLDFSAGGSGLKLPKPSKSQTPPKERVHHEHPNSPPATEFFGGAPSTASATEVQAASAPAASVSTPPSPRSEKQDFLEFTGPGASEAGMADGEQGGSGLKLPKPSKSQTPPKERAHHEHSSDPPATEFFGGAPSTAEATEVQAGSASTAAVSTLHSPPSEKQDHLHFTEPGKAEAGTVIGQASAGTSASPAVATPDPSRRSMRSAKQDGLDFTGPDKAETGDAIGGGPAENTAAPSSRQVNQDIRDFTRPRTAEAGVASRGASRETPAGSVPLPLKKDMVDVTGFPEPTGAEADVQAAMAEIVTVPPPASSFGRAAPETSCSQRVSIPSAEHLSEQQAPATIAPGFTAQDAQDSEQLGNSGRYGPSTSKPEKAKEGYPSSAVLGTEHASKIAMKQNVSELTQGGMTAGGPSASGPQSPDQAPYAQATPPASLTGFADFAEFASSDLLYQGVPGKQAHDLSATRDGDGSNSVHVPVRVLSETVLDEPKTKERPGMQNASPCCQKVRILHFKLAGWKVDHLQGRQFQRRSRPHFSRPAAADTLK